MRRIGLLALVVTFSAGVFAYLVAGRLSRASRNPQAVTRVAARLDGGAPPPPQVREGAFDHGPFERLISTHVDEQGWVDYPGLGRERAALDAYLAALATAEPRAFPDDAERLAFWINAYNGFTLRDALDEVYGKRRSVKDVPGFFDRKRHRVAREDLTLDEIEGRARAFRDPRVHFAVNCASAGCPKLQRAAYTGLRLDEQLEAAARGFLRDESRGLRVDADGNRLFVSPIFLWYAGDFTGATGGAGRAAAIAGAFVSGGDVLEYVRRYAPPDAVQFIERHRPSVRYMDYDWSLNAQETHRQTPAGTQ